MSLSRVILMLAVVSMGLTGCVSKSSGVAKNSTGNRVIASTGETFDEEKYKAILAAMDNSENEYNARYAGSEDEAMDDAEAAQDIEQNIALDEVLAPEPLYTLEQEDKFIKNIGAATSIPELLAASKKKISGYGNWAFQFVYIDKNGNQKTLTEYNPHQSMKPASTNKLFSGYLFYSSGAENKSYTKNNLAAMLHVSHNGMADSALRQVAVKKGFNNDQMVNGLRIMKQNYSSLVDSNKFTPVDGSGLDYSNKVTAALLTNLLGNIYRNGKDNGKYSDFKLLLAHPSGQKCSYNTKKNQKPYEHGYHSTIGSRLNSLAGRVHAKTGTLNKTKALAGFVDMKNGGVIVFAVIGDYFPKLKMTGDAFNKINAVVEAHARYVDAYVK